MTIYRRPDPVPRATQSNVPTAKLEPIRESRTDLSNLAAQRIFAAITSKNWAQTGLLPREDILGEELGVSRTVVREAVKSLSSKSIVQAKRRRGTVILNQQDWNFVDSELIGWMSESENFPDVSDQMLDALAATQGEILVRIANHNLDIAALREQARLIADAPADAALTALSFHRLAALLLKNDFLLSLTTSVVHGLGAHHIERLVRAGFGSDAKPYFALCEAIEARNVDGIRRHITLIFDAVLTTTQVSRVPADATPD